MYKIKNLWIIGLVGILCLSCFINVFAVEKYTIGIAAPFTGDGAMWGEMAKKGVELALEEINGEGEIELIAIYEDDKAVPMDASLVAHRLTVNKNVIAVLGHVNSSCSIAAAPIYAQGNLVMVTPCSTAYKVTHMGLKNVFRIITTDDIQAPQMADFVIDKLNIKNVAVIYENSDYGKGLVDGFTPQLEKKDGKVLGLESYIPNVDKDFSSIITKFKGTGAEALVIMGNYSEGGLITRWARSLGWDVPIIVAAGCYQQRFIDIASAKYAEGVMAFTYWLADYPDPVTQKFVARFKEKYNAEPNEQSSYYYDDVYLIAQAIKKGGTTREKLLGILPNMEYKGVTGLTKFNEYHDVPFKLQMKAVVKNGKFVALEE